MYALTPAAITTRNASSARLGRGLSKRHTITTPDTETLTHSATSATILARLGMPPP